MRLFYYEGFAAEQIAEMLGIELVTVRVHLSRARRDLGGLIENGQDDIE
jgi:DNA-directed RNA polymerase specialized sigma24 family protein